MLFYCANLGKRSGDWVEKGIGRSFFISKQVGVKAKHHAILSNFHRTRCSLLTVVAHADSSFPRYSVGKAPFGEAFLFAFFIFWKFAALGNCDVDINGGSTEIVGVYESVGH